MTSYFPPYPRRGARPTEQQAPGRGLLPRTQLLWSCEVPPLPVLTRGTNLHKIDQICLNLECGVAQKPQFCAELGARAPLFAAAACTQVIDGPQMLTQQIAGGANSRRGWNLSCWAARGVNGQPGRAMELQRRDAEQEESLQRVRSPWGRRAAA